MDRDAPGWLLFVTDQGVRSLVAIRAVGKASLKLAGGPHVVQVIDVSREPELAEKYRVVATPTLVVRVAGSEARLVGDASDERLGGARLGC